MKKIFLFESFWFLSAQILGIFVAQNVIRIGIREGKEISKIDPSEFSLLNFLAAFLIAVGFLLLVLKLSKGKNIIFKTLFILVSFVGGEVALETFLPAIMALPLIFILILLWFRTSLIWIHNLLLVLGVAGIGGVVGIPLSPEIVVCLFLALAIYDFIAVYKTKHMVKMAKSMLESQAILGIIIPQKLVDFGQKLKEVRIGDKKQKFFVLGAGDMVFPLILAVSLLSQGIIKSWIIVFFSFVGLLAGFLLFLKLGKKPMPALPPLAFFSIIGYLITKLI